MEGHARLIVDEDDPVASRFVADVPFYGYKDPSLSSRDRYAVYVDDAPAQDLDRSPPRATSIDDNSELSNEKREGMGHEISPPQIQQENNKSEQPTITTNKKNGSDDDDDGNKRNAERAGRFTANVATTNDENGSLTAARVIPTSPPPPPPRAPSEQSQKKKSSGRSSSGFQWGRPGSVKKCKRSEDPSDIVAPDVSLDTKEPASNAEKLTRKGRESGAAKKVALVTRSIMFSLNLDGSNYFDRGRYWSLRFPEFGRIPGLDDERMANFAVCCALGARFSCVGTRDGDIGPGKALKMSGETIATSDDNDNENVHLDHSTSRIRWLTAYIMRQTLILHVKAHSEKRGNGKPKIERGESFILCRLSWKKIKA